ncbi:MAG: right-handed parallel beta-helix repeat-containing protein, partial [Thermoguttaceae bacterium]|nr:right-handed parallel beta-helix repeat-containing protein [Thermoguttaceae bacterium]
VSLRNINIIDGNSVYGAAIFNRRSDLTLDSCNVQNNTGYGIYNDYGNLTISSSDLSNNSANSNLGGGLYNVSGSVVIDNSKFDNNAYSGIYNNSGSLTISNSQINSTRLANSKSYAIYNGSGQFELTDSVLKYNAQYGVYNNSNSGVNTIVNCDISNNTSSGFYINTGTVKIDHSTFLSNNNGIEMGTSSNVSISNSLIGNSSQYGITTKGTVDAYSCTIAGSAMKDVNSNAGVVMMYNTIAPSIATSNSGIVSGFYNLSSYDSWSSGTGNVTYNSEAPLFVDAENSDFHLAENSQAIDKGNNVYAVDTAGNALTVDLADAPRIQGTKIDIGAYEFDVQNLLATPEISLATDNDSIIVTISEVENATGYQIEYALNEDFTDSSVVDAQAGENVLESLTQGQTYYVRALALGDDFYSDSDYSAVQSVLLDFVPPAAPAIAVDVNGADCVTVTVSETDNAVGYCIQYSTNENFTRSTIVDVDAGEIVFRGLNPATTYYFRAYAYSDQGLNSEFSPVETVTLPAAPTLTLDVPTEFAVTADGTTVNAVWAEVKNASSYTITYSVNGSSVRTTITDIPETTFSFIGAPGSTYAVQVKANGTGDYSDSEYCESQSVFVKIPLSGLTLSTTSPEVDTVIAASFDKSDVTADYQWYSGTEIIDGATDSSFTVTTDQIGQTITCVVTGTG